MRLDEDDDVLVESMDYSFSGPKTAGKELTLIRHATGIMAK